MSNRKRPGKIERLQAKRNALIQANLSSATTEPNDLAAKTVKALGPKASRGGSSRDRLKAGSYGVGFQGPRGFNSPKDYVTKREQTPGLLAPLDANRPAFGANGSKRFREDDYTTERPSDSVQIKRGPKGRWRNH